MKPYTVLGVRNRTLMTSYGLEDSYRQKIAGTECMIEKNLEVGKGFAAHTCSNTEDRKRLRILMEKEIREGKYTQAFFDAIDKTYKDTVQDIKTFWKADHASASAAELIDRFDRFFRIYVTTIHPMVLGIYASDLQDVFESELKNALGEEVPQDEFIALVSTLLTPTRLTQVQTEEQRLMEILRQFLAGDDHSKQAFDAFITQSDIRARFQELEERCGWFHMEYLGEPHTAEDYAAQVWTRIESEGVEALLGQQSPQERLESIVSQQQEFYAAHECTKFFRDLIFAMQEYLIVLDYSKADLVEGIYYARSLLNELGRRVGLKDWVGVRYLLPDELKELLRSGKRTDESYIADRRKRYALLLEDMKIAPYFGDEADRIVEELLVRDEPGDIREFKGRTAFPGKVRGIACIVTGAQDRDKFQQGQIMVTRDTTTELTSVIKKASAIIADQGSLLSHTAIVSREFKIPCLVQTKFGTKVIKDGDEIEVDASNGTVKILSR
ncbi:MAG: PEP-utilizing enzyme [Patescibacteria group bacterium]